MKKHQPRELFIFNLMGDLWGTGILEERGGQSIIARSRGDVCFTFFWGRETETTIEAGTFYYNGVRVPLKDLEQSCNACVE